MCFSYGVDALRVALGIYGVLGAIKAGDVSLSLGESLCLCEPFVTTEELTIGIDVIDQSSLIGDHSHAVAHDIEATEPPVTDELERFRIDEVQLAVGTLDLGEALV